MGDHCRGKYQLSRTFTHLGDTRRLEFFLCHVVLDIPASSIFTPFSNFHLNNGMNSITLPFSRLQVENRSIREAGSAQLFWEVEGARYAFFEILYSDFVFIALTEHQTLS